MKIAVLLSGGVDSSVALRLLLEEGGHDITAFYLKIWLEDELAFLGECPWEEDMEFVRSICESHNVPLKVVPLQKEYLDRVVSYVLAELKRGRTPSPDILCNERIKFGAFFDAIDESFDKVASGHYAQIEEKAGEWFLKKAPDKVKDQTYFLSSLRQDQLSRALFPIGHLEKCEVRDLAEKYDLATKSRKDSQGICFLGKIKYRDFVKFHLGEREGKIIDAESGDVKGKHDGVWFYTIGQRQGIGLHGGPWYVTGRDLDKNILYVSRQEGKDKIAESRMEFSASNVHWIPTQPEIEKFEVKLRHGPNTMMADVKVISEDKVDVKLSEKDAGIAAGQSVIFYDGDYCLGRAVID
ncbi:MAG: tRNA 2-thiouridine(34) synthase MnmA [Lentisphaeraceae bacterium]|nr:tRNA 2-thiouridine(34) synthase MnmA [Lentisphaeraceae bacterium]